MSKKSGEKGGWEEGREGDLEGGREGAGRGAGMGARRVAQQLRVMLLQFPDLTSTSASGSSQPSRLFTLLASSTSIHLYIP